ncbi:hypothetical protein [Chroogloeocystis siderophila]|uniref:hypothetical protein n=1 Tax=Chroogloeocystis siderophila TaxID=329163 RepID=UPI001160EFE5|nr:hypothetical protein [Chroogloeocystis siderophila]
MIVHHCSPDSLVFDIYSALALLRAVCSLIVIALLLVADEALAHGFNNEIISQLSLSKLSLFRVIDNLLNKMSRVTINSYKL